MNSVTGSGAQAENAPANRLAGETSPYLLQHAHNPVDWYPWGREALQRAREEERPIFLSIGYSACHWCHVMERESFENAAIAQLLNERFINIKVDREERPDLDEIYMSAVVAMTGSGGWPMSVFLTPQLQPFYGGTYYPPVDMYGRPGFPSIVRAVSNAWENRRDEVLRSAEGMHDHLVRSLGAVNGQRGSLGEGLLEDAATQLEHTFDATYGGWGSAPKFPSSGGIQMLLRQHLRLPNEARLHMATFTLERMAQGGMYDHLGGGFHRYSVDEQWLVPHFEKMLYDNAQLSQACVEVWQATKNPFFMRVARETIDYVLRDMCHPEGGFYSTEDADSEGEEGKFYVWTEAEVRDRLGVDAAPLFCAYYNVRREGNFSSHETYHRGQNILHVTRPLAEVAQDFKVPLEEAERLIADARARLFTAREARVHPGKDDKIITAWNGLMLTAVARAAAAFDDEAYRTAAQRAGEFLHTGMFREGRLLRTAREGRAKLPGYLDDYAFVCNGYIDLYEATFDQVWLERARVLAGLMQELFWDGDAGGFFYTTTEHEDVLLRTRPTYDGAEPSGNSVAALALLRLSRFYNLPDCFHHAMVVLESNQQSMHRAPQGYLKMLCAVDFALGPTRELAVVSQAEPIYAEPLVRAAQQRFLPRVVVAAGAPDAQDGLALLVNRGLVQGQAAAYVCENFACELPVTQVEDLVERLG